MKEQAFPFNFYFSDKKIFIEFLLYFKHCIQFGKTQIYVVNNKQKQSQKRKRNFKK